uniref:TROVE domain-containing protein n=1 Tax=Poecilia latipinna TaxID=48699 RepID=A0A3B3V6S0_9TELE
SEPLLSETLVKTRLKVNNREVAVYTRQELNIRITTNFLLALAANLAPTKPHVRRYFCAAVQLPSDWLEIVRIYSTVSLTQHEFLHPCLPTCLKKGMVDKFKQFSEYQLAKYNTRKHRCKHSWDRFMGITKHIYCIFYAIFLDDEISVWSVLPILSCFRDSVTLNSNKLLLATNSAGVAR